MLRILSVMVGCALVLWSSWVGACERRRPQAAPPVSSEEKGPGEALAKSPPPVEGTPVGPEEFARWGMALTDVLPASAVIQDGTQGPDLEIEDRRVINGTGTWTRDQVKESRNFDRRLRVDRWRAPEGTVLLQVDVSKKQRLSFLGKSIDSADRKLPPQLVSSDGQVFEAVGYYYEDDAKVVLRYTIARTIRSLKELDEAGVSPTISRSDQKLFLIFAPSTGVEIQSFNLGPKVVQMFERPIRTK